MEEKTHVEVEKCEDENTILKDFSGFKWMSFIPGKHSLDDIAVMEIATTQARFSRFILPDHELRTDRQPRLPCYARTAD